MKNAVLIDGSWLFIRSYEHRVYKNFRTKRGFATGAVYGFLSSLRSLAKKYGDNIAVAWEGGGRQKKKAIYADYKENRPHIEVAEDEWSWDQFDPLDPQCPRDLEFPVQLQILWRALEILNIPSAKAVGYEGDDVLAAWASRLHTHPDISHIIIHTTDHDLRQCISEKCSVLDPNFDKEKPLPLAEMVRQNGSPFGLVVTKILRGDNSDNISGAKFLWPSARGEEKREMLPPAMVKRILQTRPQSMEDVKNILRHQGRLFEGMPAFSADAQTWQEIERNFDLIKLSTDCEIVSVIQPEIIATKIPNLERLFTIMEFNKFAKESNQWSKISTSVRSPFLG